MACGCLIVTSNLGALKESMNGMNTYVDIDINNFNKEKYVNEYISKLNDVMNLNDEEKETIRQNNRNYIKENYTWNVICQKFEQEIGIFCNYYKKSFTDYVTNVQMAMELFKNGSFTESYNYFNKISFYPNIEEYASINLNVGVCYFNSKQYDKAKVHFKVCRQIKNNFIINKNIALLELGRENIDKFVKYVKEAISFEFDITLANLLAEKLETLGRYHESIGIYESILRIDPGNINCLNNLGNLYLITITLQEDVDDAMDKTYGKSLDYALKYNEHRKKELILSNKIFNNLYNWKLSEDEIFRRACCWYKYFPKDSKLVTISNKLNRNKITNSKLKIGYISTDFITHPVGYMFNSILKNHDTNKFEIFCYDNSLKKCENDSTAQKLRSYNNAQWFRIEDKSDEEILSLMISHDLDILVDMMGHTRNTRMNVLQYKPAKIIISYFAYPSTNGLDETDYKFTDKYATPPETQKYFKEKLYYLPNGFQCYTPPVDIESNKDYTRDKYKIHLCCFNNPIKLSIPTIETFAEVLKRLPQAKLFLRYIYYKSSYLREHIIRLFMKYGIERERIDIGHEQLVDALSLYNKMDIVLDPFPYNGGTISSEAIYMNTPLITLAGKNYVSRVGVSLLSNLGLEKFIAKNKAEYVQKVVDLANNEAEMKLLHQTLRFRMLNSDLANSVSFTKNIEAAYQDMANKFNY